MCNTYADVKTIAGDAGSNARIIYKLVKPTEVKLGADGIVTWYHPDVPKEFHLQLNKAVDGIWGEELTPIGDEVIILGNTAVWKYDFSQQIRERGEDRYCVTISAIPLSAAFEESDRAWSDIQTYEKPYFDVAAIDDIEFAIERYKDHITATYLNITDSALYYTIVPTGQYSLDNPPEIDTSGDGVPLKGLGYMAWDQMTLDGFTSDEAADVFMVAVNDIGMKSDIVCVHAPEYTAPHFSYHLVTDTTYSFDITASHKVQGMIIVGKYEGNTLKGLALHKMTAPFFSYSVADSPIEAEGSTYKIFFWDGADTMTELCSDAEGNITI